MLVDDKFRIGTLIDKANESLAAAELLTDNGQYEEAVLRCYHAVFFSLRAFLKKKNITLEKTSDSLSEFKKNFVDTKSVPKPLYEDLTAVINAGGFDISIDSVAIDEAFARSVYEKADRFFSEISDRI